MTAFELNGIEKMYADELYWAVDEAEQGGATLITRDGKPAALVMPLTRGTVTEHATRLGSGTMQIRPNDIDRVVPLATWIAASLTSGAAVYWRQIVVVDDWTEIPSYTDELAKAQSAWITAEILRIGDCPPPPVTAVAVVLGLDPDTLWTHVEGIHGWEPHDEGYEAAVWAAAACTDHNAEFTEKQP